MSSEPQETIKDLTTNPDKTFDALWTDHGIPAVRNVQGHGLTPVYNQGSFEQRLRADRDELDAHNLQDSHVFRGMAKHAIVSAVTADDDDKVDASMLEEMQRHNIIDRNVAERSTPWVFDPEILDSLRDDAPLAFERTPRQGQSGGYEAVYVRMDRRQRPIGRVPEAVARRLQDLARDFGLNRERVPMRIYADTAEISDFSATASAHYMSLEDLGIGARLSEYALFDEQELLYGRYGLDGVTFVDGEEFDYVEGDGAEVPLEGGSPVGEYGARGLAEWYRLADEAAAQIDRHDTTHYVDKSDVSEDIAKDIKREITDITQGPYAARPQDLEIWTSNIMVDVLENEFVPRARHETNGTSINFGGEDLSIKQDIPVFGSHNVDEHHYVAQDEDNDWEEYESPTTEQERTVGDLGDVFIVNTATLSKRELAPFSSFPLAVRGASDEIAMVAYDAIVERSGGFFGKMLSGYDIPDITASA
ncbi:hypothetical protein [Natronoglomus mannanivorans]|uniref:Uncharacterized protein n=1 Tax=Natronoglomus mannanivorans TaxID=2979990 RepID=A0AAP2Z1F4_9EURY|nr:hypothetical protein [Halobacteria archaeon AArc-xg1-1]